MFIRPCYRRKNGKRHAYWALMESYRTERGPRQRVVAYLGQLDELFGLEYDLLLYDVTTVEEIVQTMEHRYGRADRIWVMDRGMVSQENLAFLRQGQRRYIVGTPKSMLRQFQRQLLAEDWHAIREGLEVKLCPMPDGQETFVLCRSRDRREKEKAMHARFEQRIEAGLEQIAATCRRQRLHPAMVGQRVGRLLGRNSRAAGLFAVDVVLPTRAGPEIRKRCVTRPTDHQAVLLQRLGLRLPTRPMADM